MKAKKKSENFSKTQKAQTSKWQNYIIIAGVIIGAIAELPDAVLNIVNLVHSLVMLFVSK